MKRLFRRIAVVAAVLLFAPAPRAEIVINEIMYNTPGPDVEYVELVNTGPATVDLDGWYLLDDLDTHAPCVLAGTLAPGEYLVIVGSLELFSTEYPGVTNVNPNPFDPPGGGGFGLGRGDRVRIFDDEQVPIDEVEYGTVDPWPVEPDGLGSSLELLSPVLDNALASSWGASVNGPPQGTPGTTNSIFVSDLPPVIEDVSREIDLPRNADSVTITVEASDDHGLDSVHLFVDTGSGFVSGPMYDDGLSGDGDPGDSRYGAVISPQPTGTVVRYYVSVADDAAQSVSDPPDAPAAYFAYTVDYSLPQLVINEILALNQNGITDELGQHEDWLEILNRGPVPVALGGMFLTDDPGQPRLWELPAGTLPPGGRLVVWCDNDEDDGPLHAGFRLAMAGGFTGLFDTVEHGNLQIHGLTYGPQNPDASFGYLPEGADAPEYIASPTPLELNDEAAPYSAVCINEFFALSQVGVPDWIELYNRGEQVVDIGGWRLSDDVQVTEEDYGFPPGTTIAPGAFLSVDESELGFGIAANGNEVLLLTSGDPETPEGRDYFDYGPQLADVSRGRFPDGTANWHFFSAWSLGASNLCSPGSPSLDPVEQLRFTSKTVLVWDEIEGEVHYDVVNGDLRALRGAAGDFSAAAIRCLANNDPIPAAWDAETPLAGQEIFYLVRAANPYCGFGSYDGGSPFQAAPRDEGIAGAGSACP